MAVVIYRCKACNSVVRVDYRREMRAIGCGRKEAVYFRSSDGARNVQPVPCCGRPMAWNFLKATMNQAVRCDARCVNAKGHNCECSCGGENHAGGGMFTGLLAA